MSFARILRSSAIMGGATAVTLVTSFVRAKIIAIIFGPAGIGMFAILSSFNANISTLSGWGLGISGVRSISSSSLEDRPLKVAAVRRLGSILAWCGLSLVMLGAYPCSLLIFGDVSYSNEMLIAGLAVPCIIVTAVFSAMIQARGDLASLARVQVIGAITGLIAGIPLICLAGTIGIALAIFLASALPAILTWRIARQKEPSVAIEGRKDDIWQLVVLGTAFMGSALLSQASVLLVRTIIVRDLGLDAAGQFHAANAIAMSLPGLVLVSMGTDFFPRVAAAESEIAARRLTELQIKTALLFSLPLLCGLLTLGPLAVRILYDGQGFDRASQLLSWMIWGVFFRIIAWPMGYWLMARGSSAAMMGVDLASNLLAATLPLFLMPYFGLKGAAAAFSIGCLAYACILLCVVRLRSGTWISGGVLVWCVLAAVVLVLAQLSVVPFQSEYIGVVPTAIVTIVCAAFSYRLVKRETNHA